MASGIVLAAAYIAKITVESEIADVAGIINEGSTSPATEIILWAQS